MWIYSTRLYIFVCILILIDLYMFDVILKILLLLLDFLNVVIPGIRIRKKAMFHFSMYFQFQNPTIRRVAHKFPF